jgi:hypothetical protein
MKRALLILVIFFTAVAWQLPAQVLNVSRIMQSQNQWCWAGVSACVLEFYGKSLTQCQIAEYTRSVEQFADVHFGSADCCLSPATCNNWNYNWGGPGSIEDILLHFANIPSNKIGPISLSEVTTSIGLNRPMIVRWGWTTGGGHFVVVHGISGENLYYMNPWPGEGKKIASYEWMKASPDHSWTQTNTFTVSPQPPAAARAISGSPVVCQGRYSVNYSVPLIDRALTYDWTLPEGAKGASTTESIRIDYSPAAVSGTLSVEGRNNLGSGIASSLGITVDPLPAPAGAIVGPAMVCQRQRSVEYTVPVIAGATSYVWTVTGEGESAGTSTTNRLTLDFGIKTGTGTIGVKGKNDCGEGEEYILDYKLSPIPEAPVITQKGNELTSGSPAGNQWYDSTGPIAGATAQTYTITASGDYYAIVTLDGCSSDPSEVLTLVLNGTDVTRSPGSLRVYPNPFTGLITLELEGAVEPVLFEILNSPGQTLIRSELMQTTTLDLTSLPKGVYLIRIIRSTEILVRKLVRE